MASIAGRLLSLADHGVVVAVAYKTDAFARWRYWLLLSPGGSNDIA